MHSASVIGLGFIIQANHTVQETCATTLFQFFSIWFGLVRGGIIWASVRFLHGADVQGVVLWLFCYASASGVFGPSFAHLFFRSLSCLQEKSNKSNNVD